ncbi:hypothetical protein K1T71_007960 [Dendrolimus kikuchii]|uniref:Uncharacterized protein n=1 Tax=Dendrolimus kikuchii TaxID=765133 RepID=A0ACC1CYX8_9NEOP|nr:hypothetical protein K1T71_007960 [Dendrolimus kikuchii]
MATLQNNYDRDDDEDVMSEEARIEWSNLIFLPFHPVWKLIILFSVLIKIMLVIYKILYYADIMMPVREQVTDKARRREHLPKSAFLLLIDILSLIPFYRLVVTDLCPPVQLYPNILAFSEFFIIYRIVEYFSLATTHSFWDILTGYLLMIISCVNCVTCFLLLLTKNGLCENCQYGIYDWRTYIMHKLNETDEDFATYVYGSSFVMTFVVKQSFDETKPSTVSEFLIITMMIVAGHLFTILVVLPKLFAEAILRLRGICTFHPHVYILVEETKRRNSSSDAHVPVENFYKLMWSKRKGVTSIPEVIEELPRYLRVDLSQDLIWSFFYHSPTLRKTSTSFKRWICEYMHYDYKLPGEKFFAGPHCHTNLYYIKSGIVQLISDDDGSTPIVSVSGGTIFGDVNFLVPPFKRKIPVKCLTYCEVYYLSRQELLRAIHKHPEDRLMIRQSVQNRIKHAKTLYACKKNIRGIDRADDEGIEWVKKRWWEISHAVANWKNKTKPKDQTLFEIPPEESAYHCAKYIGQLVLCNEMQLQTKSMFTSVEFPWILMPQSIFGKIWRRIVILTVLMVLLIYPPNIARKGRSSLFLLFKFWTDLIYVLDICVSLITPLEDIEHTSAKFATVMFARCKSLTFFLDVLATLWFEYLVVIIGKSEYFYFIQFNRLIKIYILFYGEFNEWTLNLKPIFNVSRKIALMLFSFLYIEAYFIYILMTFAPEITSNYFFGEIHCEVGMMKQKCDPASKGILNIAVGWLYQMLYCEYFPLTLYDIYVAIIVGVFNFCVYVYCKAQFVAVLYLKYRDVTDYQFFVFNLKKYYQNYKINQNLLKRLDRYLECHWKYYHGVSVMHPHLLKNEPYDIYWKVHGEVAERIISHSKAFVGADPALVRELAYKAKFLILPRNSTLFLFGVQCKNVTWIAQGFIKCEYHDENGNLLKVQNESGQMISLSSVFLGKAALRTYIADTECEYQTKLRDRVFHLRATTSIIDIPHVLGSRSSPFEGDFWGEPESKFMKIWMSFRALIVIVSIVSATLQGGSGAVIRWQLVMISAFCDCIGLIDIVLKIFLAYHDHRGLLITDKRMCLMHYLTRGFVIDIMGCVPWFEFFINRVDTYVEDDHVLMVSTVCKFGHVYILFGYFNYIADAPTVNIALIKVSYRLQFLQFV